MKENKDKLNRFSGTESYVITDELRSSVNAAIALEKPLLIKGEPGTGKTLLAEAIAEGLGLDLITWNIKSTTKAQDGLYVYDTVQRLYDSQFGEGDVANIEKYIKPGKLGEAFTKGNQAVLLIDEIDKADLEFPNDLLWELDRMEFYIPETKETVRAKSRPIVVITSNAEKELPDAFLRRCIFHYIAFPEYEQMEEIVRVHYPDIDGKLLALAMKKFYEIREMDSIRKKPSTSELLDWLMALSLSGISLQKIGEKIPYLGVLLKKDQDLDAITKKGRGRY
ncbi:MAG: MoxR family ATPase [Clostridiales Family XIII bacterium]|jgi:MoxR-like ATPase|nr:MoxR family ATPase [Clostridiales Family XIII bacterium]